MPFSLMEKNESIRDVSQYQLRELVKSISSKGLIYSKTMKVLPQWQNVEDQEEFEKLLEDDKAIDFIEKKQVKCLIMAGNHRFLVNMFNFSMYIYLLTNYFSYGQKKIWCFKILKKHQNLDLLEKVIQQYLLSFLHNQSGGKNKYY